MTYWPFWRKPAPRLERAAALEPGHQPNVSEPVQDDRCPYCGSEGLTYGGVEVEGREAWQAVGCNTCDTTWDEVYTFDRHVKTNHFEDEAN